MGLIKSLGEHTQEVVNRSRGNLSSMEGILYVVNV